MDKLDALSSGYILLPQEISNATFRVMVNNRYRDADAQAMD